MSMSLRDQLLQAGLVSQKQVKDAEREQQRQSRQLPKHKRVEPAVQPPARAVQTAKAARDQALNRQQQDKAKRKALLAQIKQLIDRNRVPPVESEDYYNFVDGNKVRHMAVNPALRSRLVRGEIVVVRHEGCYYLVPAAIAARIRERDDRAVIAGATEENSPTDEAYRQFTVPDDLTW